MMNIFKNSYGYSLMALILLGISGNTNAQKPFDTEGMNIIFIVADDLGWSDTELYGTTSLYKTKNIERLADRGLTFTNAYAASPLCSPTRATLLTGQASARNGVVSAVGHIPKVLLKPELKPRARAGEKAIEVMSATRLNNELPTLAKQMKESGYATAHFGKWHLGSAPYTPLEHGFDVDVPHANTPGPAGGYLAPWKYTDFELNYPGEHIEDRMSEEAISWMKALDKEQPFFMNYWMFSVHGPWGGKKDLIEKYKQKVDINNKQRSPSYAAMVHSMDDAVGALLDEVDRLGIADNTAIIFFSDNGGNMHTQLKEYNTDGKEYHAVVTDNAPLKGGKATMYEGGIRVPCVIVWPGLTSPGTKTDARIQSTDFYPTLLNLIGASKPKDYPVDGIDFSPVLKDHKWERKAPMFTYFPAPAKGVPNWLPPAITVHDGKWKLIRLFHQGENQAHDYLLYDLEKDISETKNLAAKYPKEVKRLDALLEKHIKETGAVVPVPNPDFDSTKYRPELIGVQNKKMLVEVNVGK
jgi:arylsulfatase A-like enzyme